MYNWCCTLLVKVKGQNRQTRHGGFQVQAFYAHVVGSFQFLHFLSDAASGVRIIVSPVSCKRILVAVF